MPGKSPAQPVSPESLARRHEVSEKSVRNALMVGGAAAFLLVFSLVACGEAIRILAQRRPMQQMQSLGLVTAPNLKPLDRFPKPNLNIDDDHGERLALETIQNERLNSYGWVDRTNGIVRIPIARAIDLLLQRGFSVATNGSAPPTDGSPAQLIQNIPNQP